MQGVDRGNWETVQVVWVADEIHELYAVADDGEAAVLDRLRRRAGHVWEHVGCWTNPGAAESCENCDRPRAELAARGQLAVVI